MSNVYIQEPPTNGKVLMVTSCGDIDIELWSKETPKASRNFIQLCLEGYYDKIIFHRVVKDFIVQGGDPTGTGHGGESIYESPFKDEFHQRLRFNRRGLVAMANAGPNDNGSQFFFTLGSAPELNNKHTIFGKVTGNTLFNMLKLGDCETDRDERPLYPPKIIRTEVLLNPFDDIVLRVVDRRNDEREEKKPQSQSKATKNFSLLSFGEEAEEDEDEIIEASKALKGKSKSSHDLINDPKFSSEPAVKSFELSEDLSGDVQRKRKGYETIIISTEEQKKLREDIRKKLKKVSDENKTRQLDDDEKIKQINKSEEYRKEAEEIKKELRKSKKEKNKEKPAKVNEEMTEEKDDAIEAFKKELHKYVIFKKQLPSKGPSREEHTLSLLSKFQNNLLMARSDHFNVIDEKFEPQLEENLTPHTQAEDDKGWMNHSLHFEVHETKVKDANVRDEDTFEIFDPRNPLNQRRREASQQAMKNKK